MGDEDILKSTYILRNENPLFKISDKDSPQINIPSPTKRNPVFEEVENESGKEEIDNRYDVDKTPIIKVTKENYELEKKYYGEYLGFPDNFNDWKAIKDQWYSYISSLDTTSKTGKREFNKYKDQILEAKTNLALIGLDLEDIPIIWDDISITDL